jgi:hypothetical protein
MAEAPKPMSRQEINEKVVLLAWKDDGFRKAFLADPKGEAERRLGIKLPPMLKITAVAEEPDSLHFVIPAKPAPAGGELSDSDLEKVAGGVDVVTTMASVIWTSIAAIVGTAIASGKNTENKNAGKDNWG